MLGCDIVQISRLQDRSPEFIRRIFTPDEYEEYLARGQQVNYLAGRWAAKEAVFKACGLRQISVLTDINGKPYIKDHPDIAISISHEREYAIAVAVERNTGL